MDNEVNHSIDDRRQVRQQEQRILSETTNLMLTMTRPMIYQQKALARFWADSFDAWINNFEQTTEAISNAMLQQGQRQQQGGQTPQQSQYSPPRGGEQQRYERS